MNDTGKAINCLSLLLFCFLSFPVFSQTVSNYVKEEKIRGSVKALTEIHNDGQKFFYLYNEKGLETEKWFFSPSEELRFRLTRKFDTKGLLTEETHLDKGISPVLRIEYGYDNTGLPIGRSLFGSNTKLLEKFMYRYNAARQIVDSVRYDLYDNLVEKFSWKYDSINHVIQKTGFKSQDSSYTATTYECDTNWKILKIISDVSPDKSPEVTYEYNEKGTLTEENRLYFENGNTLFRKLKYDSAGNMILSAEYKPDGSSIKKFTYNYDSANRKIAESWFNGADKMFFRYTHHYNENNDKIAMTGFSDSGAKEVEVSWSYEYDAAGNWTKRTQYVNGLAGEIITRNFEYY
ncbi:MAG: hypothetical protein HZB42_06090 [Sphingobacteriales bacterium]|nr:hypothetical protein [Sphingobacteriales bacterium]